jgi:hypothetical protein
MQWMKAATLALVLALVTAALAGGLALAAPSLGIEAWMGTAIGVIAGASLAAGVLWGALARPAPVAVAESGRFQRLGSRLAQGEAGPDGKALPLGARFAAALTDSDRMQYLPGSTLTYLRAGTETLEEGRSTAWEVHYFSQSGRRILRLQVARDAREATAYRVTAEMEDLGRWLEPMAPDKQEVAWEALLLRNLEVPPGYTDSTAVAEALARAGRESAAGVPPRRIRSMTVGVARPTLEWAPTVFWIVEAEEGRHRIRYYCDVLTAEVQRSEQLA